MPLWENVLLGHQAGGQFTNHGLIDRVRLPPACPTRYVPAASMCVRRASTSAPSTLSGGNQQKLIVGREMLAKPTVLIAAHPTRGVDVGAQAVIWDILRDARAAGLATLLISADLEELIGLSDRLLVMLRGEIVADLDPATVDQGRPRRLHDRGHDAGRFGRRRGRHVEPQSFCTASPPRCSLPSSPSLCPRSPC